MTGRERRRNKQLPNDFREKTGHWKLKVEALENTVWITDFGRVCRPVAKQMTE
jgi:hypothetical protein